MSDDPERLLAEALRAQARYAPPAAPTAPTVPSTPPAQTTQPTPPARPTMPAARPAPGTDLPGGSAGYGLLSGAADGEPPARRANDDTDTHTAQAGRGSHRLETEPLAARWVLLLAASLGLAVGSVIGLFTVL
ncbi:hypothetical protein [Saccharomonospora sp. NB11]|jgi:hypothetical protein|uniref:hypothetical protein n=1 Tax=Saccharomonospora sp. NB11 TaxID=1642298 RepID=UPI0018D1BE2C|nr:hypothetical protein [Saccharomonospora sp. NB11]